MPLLRLPLIAALASIAAHAGAYAMIERYCPRSFTGAAPQVSFVLDPPPPPPPSPEPSAALPAPPPPEPTHHEPPPPTSSSKPKPARVSPPAASEPVALTGVTLTNPTGLGWASVAGNGLEGGPLRNPHPAPRHPQALPHARTPPVAARPIASAPPLVSIADLSQPPKPPALGNTLARHFPADARRAGREGTATVRLRVGPRGLATVIAVVSQSSAGFGDACRRALEGSHWSPPIARGGRPATTLVSYRCRFLVNR